MSATTEERLAEENRRLRQEIEVLRTQRDAFESQKETLQSQANALRAQTEALQSQKEALRIQIQELESIRRNLEHTVAVYKRCLFGSRSEKIDPKELEARIAQAAAEAREQLAKEKRPGDPPPEAEEEKPEDKARADKLADQEKKRKARPHGRNRFPAHLPRRRIEHPVDPAQALCACCADHPPLIQVGEDTCEKLVKLPVQYEVHVHVYPQMVCQRCHEGVTSAPRQDNSLKADVSVIADVVVKKYVEHQPLYRQQQGFDRLHIPISRQTLCGWTAWCSDQVEPIVQAMTDYICTQPLIQSDETPVRMQLADGQMETARLWAYGLPWAEIVFDFRTDKSQEGPKEFLQWTSAGFLQTDGGSSYVPVVEALELLHVACSFGISSFQQIPGFSACPDLSRPVHLVLFLGYEGDRVLATYEHVQPMQTTLVIPFPPYQPSWAGRTERFNANLLGLVGENATVKVDAVDPGATDQALGQILGEKDKRSPHAKVVCPLGTKPQTLGIYSYVRECTDPPAIVYAGPLRHNHEFFSHGIGATWVLKKAS